MDYFRKGILLCNVELSQGAGSNQVFSFFLFQRARAYNIALCIVAIK